MGSKMLCRDIVFSLAGGTVHDRDMIRLGPGPQAPAEAPRHAHEMVVVEVGIGTAQRTPPHPQPSAGLAHSKVRVQHYAIDTIVTAFEKIVVKGAQLVRHVRSVTATPPSRQPLTRRCFLLC